MPKIDKEEHVLTYFMRPAYLWHQPLTNHYEKVLITLTISGTNFFENIDQIQN